MSRTGRPPVSREEKRTLGTDRGEKRSPPPRSSRFPEPPEWLCPDARVLWDEWARELGREGVLTVRDGPALAMLADAVVKVGQLTDALGPDIAKYAHAKSYPTGWGLLKQYQRLVLDLSARLGFSPLDRERLPHPPPAPKPSTEDADESTTERFFSGPRIAP